VLKRVGGEGRGVRGSGIREKFPVGRPQPLRRGAVSMTKPVEIGPASIAGGDLHRGRAGLKPEATVKEVYSSLLTSSCSHAKG